MSIQEFKKPIGQLVSFALLRTSEQTGLISTESLIDYGASRLFSMKKSVRDGNETWGLIHGHYRRFTLAQFTGLVMAKRECPDGLVYCLKVKKEHGYLRAKIHK